MGKSLFGLVYVPLMQACMTGTYVMGSGRMIDHRYFYVEDGRVHYTCGLARQAMMEFLRTNVEEDIFLGFDRYQAFNVFKNSSIIGFTVEQILISRIASAGLRFNRQSIPAARITPFRGSSVELTPDMQPTYLVPLQFNLKTIDSL